MATTTTIPNSTKVIETRYFVAVDPVQNNNKFYKVEIFDGTITQPGRKGVMMSGHIRTTWGRVGAPIEKCESMLLDNQSDLDAKIREKTQTDKYGNLKPAKDKPAYTEVKTVGAPEPVNNKLAVSGIRVTSAAVAKAAVADIAGGCAITAALVKKLAETNKHELIAATGGRDERTGRAKGLDIDLETGLVRTALGVVVTLDAVKEARSVLDKMLPFVQKHNTETKNYTDLLGIYLRLVPQDVGTRRQGWHSDFINITAQTSLLDQLETSVELAEQRMKDALTKGDAPAAAVAAKAMFECKLALVEDKAVWERIRKEFHATVNQGHTSASLKPVRVYSVTIPHMVEAFDRDGKKVGNVRELWHGTRVFNILSILKRGFVLPTQLSTAQTTGAMYGNGVYFSNQSTKSLNYSQGYWDGGRRDNNCYMFRVDVAMGREYIPSYSGDGKRSGYDSCWAKAGHSGVRNDEQIVYRTSQANIKYLVEFDSK
jgi:poly [ADP-ribose] polymerase